MTAGPRDGVGASGVHSSMPGRYSSLRSGRGARLVTTYTTASVRRGRFRIARIGSQLDVSPPSLKSSTYDRRPGSVSPSVNAAYAASYSDVDPPASAPVIASRVAGDGALHAARRLTASANVRTAARSSRDSEST